MAILVDVQGEFLDTIEFNVSQSSANVTESVQNIKEANTLYDSIRKKKIFLMGVGTAALVTIFGPTIAKIAPLL